MDEYCEGCGHAPYDCTCAADMAQIEREGVYDFAGSLKLMLSTEVDPRTSQPLALSLGGLRVEDDGSVAMDVTARGGDVLCVYVRRREEA